MELSSHISKQFDAELELIRNRVLEMGGLVEQQLTKAIAALVDQNLDAAEEVIRDDYQVNDLEIQIDEQCTQIVAKRQPTASDLRLVMTIIKTISDLERIGDESKRIARMAIHLVDEGHGRLDISAFGHMGKHVVQMLHDALDSLARSDTEAAVSVAREDIKVDREYEGITRQIITFMMEDPRSIPRCLDILWSARALERIGDRSCNIGEYVIYLVKGKDVRHIGLEAVEKAAQVRKQ